MLAMTVGGVCFDGAVGLRGDCHATLAMTKKGRKMRLFGFLGVKEAYGCQVLGEIYRLKSEQMFVFNPKGGSCPLQKPRCM